MEGLVFDIQHFSIYDGPGIRTTVFLKGCPLRCIWCHNPESWQKEPQRSLKDPLKLIGRKMTPEEIMVEVEKDNDYYLNSGGGITLSGGEPMLQFEFTLELLKLAKEKGIHTCLETSGYSPKENFEEIYPWVDLFLFDYKATGKERHMKFVGVENELILSNLEYLNVKGAHLILRCPLIPTINDQEEHFKALAALSNQYSGVEGVEILPYHDFGKGKWEEVGLQYALDKITTVDSFIKEKWKQRLIALGCKKLF